MLSLFYIMFTLSDSILFSSNYILLIKTYRYLLLENYKNLSKPFNLIK